MSKTFLKIKIKSLAAESRIIRAEEKKWPGASDTRTSLHWHRINDVRSESRCALLAYGFIRGRAYTLLERNPLIQPDWKRVANLVTKFGTAKVTVEGLIGWSEDQRLAA